MRISSAGGGRGPRCAEATPRLEEGHGPGASRGCGVRALRRARARRGDDRRERARGDRRRADPGRHGGRALSSTAVATTAPRGERSSLRYGATVALLAAAYFGTAKLGYTFAFSGPVAAIVWLPAGVGIAFLYVGGLRLWPGVLIGDLLANDYSLLPWGTALAQTVGNVLEVVVAAVILRRLVRRGSPLAT